MNPSDLRNANFTTLRATLPAKRAAVLAAFAVYGPATTRQAAGEAGIDILTLRPRATELEQMGLLVCVGNQIQDGIAHGVYRVATQPEWENWRARQLDSQVSGQRQLL